MSRLPVPGPDALALSQALSRHIAGAIEAAGGWLDFARYMELALYAPGLGYYSAGAQKFGAAGDFVTAPELTPLFGRTLARQAAEVLAQTGGEVLELGAGSGRLALDLLRGLAELDALPPRYAILELSADLRERQRALFAREAPDLLPRLHWLDALPERFSGVVLGNEVLDALPVHLVHYRNGIWQERGVIQAGEAFAWQDRPLVDGALFELADKLPVEGDYLTEISLAAPALIRSLAAMLERGVLLFLDYGFPRAEYYHPQRSQGTLMCHYRHQAHADPFVLPGLTDITAHVDFTAVAESGFDAGLKLLGYASQAGFLINCGITDLLQGQSTTDPGYIRQAAALQKLMSPAEMGELFKVIALGRGLTQPLMGFVRGDRSHAL
ncbi:SAM-dependent MidA family methyltransferase [Sulfuritortus calidifontis]|uniref:SAM-dependent MidA family methyltransferase n=1 Tax=Sulfuritortus calidifontis TaxID=1914471 RepID=A0A4V2UQT9_9PROT|nr:SAM-dependent methyltransferase [Sulfuritortus calidifontis]TCS72468.1 SAM-dependent MidA family methyltransferase [Sulfuritortus calidifontis]